MKTWWNKLNKNKEKSLLFGPVKIPATKIPLPPLQPGKIIVEQLYDWDLYDCDVVIEDLNLKSIIDAIRIITKFEHRVETPYPIMEKLGNVRAYLEKQLSEYMKDPEQKAPLLFWSNEGNET